MQTAQAGSWCSHRPSASPGQYEVHNVHATGQCLGGSGGAAGLGLGGTRLGLRTCGGDDGLGGSARQAAGGLRLMIPTAGCYTHYG